jgi:hypothetical protein
MIVQGRSEEHELWIWGRFARLMDLSELSGLMAILMAILMARIEAIQEGNFRTKTKRRTRRSSKGWRKERRKLWTFLC